MAGYEIRRVGTTTDALGEGPLWDVEEQALYWVDIRGQLVRRLEPASGKYDEWPVPDAIGSMALRERGGAVLALRDGFHAFDFATGRAEPIAPVEAGDPRTRMNDGKCDREGRFLAGTMKDQIDGEALGALYRLNADLSVDRLLGDVIVTNGPCFSPDGRTFYFSDTGRRSIVAYDYGPEVATLVPRETVVYTREHGSAGDGATVDAEGCIWSAFVRTGQVARFTPDGRLDRLIDMPVGRPSSVMFGGRDLDVLYVTSIRDSGNLRDESEGAGGLFAIDGLGVRGLPEPRFSG